MKFIYFALLLFFSYNACGQIWGINDTRTEIRDDAGLQGANGAKSGFFETPNPVNYPTGASSWWHLLDVRHDNPANNFAMQISGSFFDRDLFYRKTSDNASMPWNKFLAEDENGNLINNKIAVVTTAGQSFFTARQLGGNYGYPDGMFRAITDNTSGNNYFFDGLSGSERTFSVRSSGVGYFAGGLGIGTPAPQSALDITQDVTTYNTTTMQSWNWLDDVNSRNWGLRLDMYHSGNSIDYHFVQRSATGDQHVLTFKNGYSGIGTDDPNAQMHIRGSGQTTANLSSSANLGGALYIQDNQGYPNSGGAVLFGAAQGAFAGIKSLIYDGSANTTGALAFSTRNNISDGTLTERMRITAGGSIGIGTSNPASVLEVKSSDSWDASTAIRITNNAANYGRAHLVITGRIQDGNDNWHFGTQARNAIVFAENAAASGANVGSGGDEKFSMQLEGNSNSFGFLSKQMGDHPIMSLSQNGGVGINTTGVPGAYKLAVGGNILAENVTVMLQGNWPDYVFRENYRLRPLSELKKYIDQYHHLPEMPSDKQVATDGQNLGELNRLLTKKVEELSLYLIEKDTEVKELKAASALQDRRLGLLEARLKALPAK